MTMLSKHRDVNVVAIHPTITNSTDETVFVTNMECLLMLI